jgi:hypothetical protein
MRRFRPCVLIIINPDPAVSLGIQVGSYGVDDVYDRDEKKGPALNALYRVRAAYLQCHLCLRSSRRTLYFYTLPAMVCETFTRLQGSNATSYNLSLSLKSNSLIVQ